MKKLLRGKGIQVADEYLYAHMLQIKNRLEAAKKFGRKYKDSEARVPQN